MGSREKVKLMWFSGLGLVNTDVLVGDATVADLSGGRGCCSTGMAAITAVIRRGNKLSHLRDIMLLCCFDRRVQVLAGATRGFPVSI